MRVKVQNDLKYRSKVFYEASLLDLKKSEFLDGGLKVHPLYYYTRIRNYCVVSLRSRFVFSFLRASRVALNKGFLCGFSQSFLKKYSW